MRYSREHKSETRKKIVATARRLFASKGYAATSIDAIMRACGLTHGGFYAHFKSKSELYREAIGDVASALLGEKPEANAESDWLEMIFDAPTDVASAPLSGGVPNLAFLAADASRRESAVRTAYSRALEAITTKVRERSGAGRNVSDTSILSLTAMLVGATAIGEATDDAALRAKLLASCRERMEALSAAEREEIPPVYYWMAAN